MGSPTVVDLFCGVGGFSLGFAEAGFDVVLAVDSNEPTLDTYQKNFPETATIDVDLSEANTQELLSDANMEVEDVDIVIGGPPCQGFSVMGKQHEDDERNQLLLDFARHLLELLPRYFVVENVPGLMSEIGEEYLNKFLSVVETGGYSVVRDIQKLDAKDFDVPQDRERVIIIGYQNDVPEPSYPQPNGRDVSSWDAIRDLPVNLEAVSLDDDVYKGELGEPSEYVDKINSFTRLTDEVVDGISGLDPVDHSEKVRERFAEVEPGKVESVSRYPRLKKSEPSNTLRAGSSRSRGTHTPARPIHPAAPRCITVREAARLQSFPDWFQFHSTKYYGLRQIGNSVPPLVAKSIAEEIRSGFESIQEPVITHAE